MVITLQFLTNDLNLWIGKKMHNITNNSILNRGSTPILTNLVGATQETSTKNLKQMRASVLEKKSQMGY